MKTLGFSGVARAGRTLSQGDPRFSGREADATVGTSAGGRLQRKELEGVPGAASRQARDCSRRRVCGRCAKGEGGVCERLDAAAKRRDGSGDVTTAAALLRESGAAVPLLDPEEGRAPKGRGRGRGALSQAARVRAESCETN